MFQPAAALKTSFSGTFLMRMEVLQVLVPSHTPALKEPTDLSLKEECVQVLC